MSYSVLIVGEDPTNNGYILEPVVQRVLSECGRARAKVEVLRNPRTEGYEHAKKLLVEEVFDRYRHKDLILFIPDADCRNREDEFRALEKEAEARDVLLICCAAVQELEVWLMAGHANQLDETWAEVRADCSVKENVFEPFLKAHGNPKRPGAGRDLLTKSTVANYDALVGRCPEIATLQARIAQALNTEG